MGTESSPLRSHHLYDRGTVQAAVFWILHRHVYMGMPVSAHKGKRYATEILELDYIPCNCAPAVIRPILILYELHTLGLSGSAAIMYNRITRTPLAGHKNPDTQATYLGRTLIALPPNLL